MLIMWQLCSGFAHGMVWPQLGFSENIKTPVATEPGVVAVRFESSHSRMLWTALAAHETVEAAIALFEQRARGI